ncbi:DUF481 domain-containing protein [Robiginitomaculum antarcticum]|uniref:DUF481 domain-containing protein n=1 Tax=Robiginitomaculum antarcticum TaxID=437507 RepID=UPI00036B0837|nr:DUF481 domain-containing protein [Robiginitomaculum antarcticum]
MHKYIISAAIAALVTAPAFGQDDGWSGEASLSGNATTGNTETTDLGIGLALQRQSGVWRNKFDATVDYGTVNDQDTKNRLFLGYQLDRDINEHVYVFGTGDYFKDDFGSYQNGYFVGAGAGYHALKSEPTFWDLEAALGYRNQETRETGIFGQPGYIDSESVGEAALRGSSDFKYNFNEAVSFYNKTEVITSSSDTYLWNDIGISANLMGNLSAKFGYRVDYHTDVPVGVEQTDTVTRIALVYAIN